MTSGIYSIRNTLNMHIYIGQALHIPNRFCRHRWELRKGIHSNPRLQRAWNKYGEEAFLFEVVELVEDPSLLTLKEQFYLDKPNIHYNISRSAESPRRGAINSPRMRELISKARRGQALGPMKLSHREAISKAHIGKVKDQQWLSNLSKSLRGRVFSEETRSKMAASHLGISRGPHSPEHRRKLSEAHIGKKMSVEARLRMSISAKSRVRKKNDVRKSTRSSKRAATRAAAVAQGDRTEVTALT